MSQVSHRTNSWRDNQQIHKNNITAPVSERKKSKIRSYCRNNNFNAMSSQMLDFADKEIWVGDNFGRRCTFAQWPLRTSISVTALNENYANVHKGKIQQKLYKCRLNLDYQGYKNQNKGGAKNVPFNQGCTSSPVEKKLPCPEKSRPCLALQKLTKPQGAVDLCDCLPQPQIFSLAPPQWKSPGPRIPVFNTLDTLLSKLDIYVTNTPQKVMH